MSFNEDLIHSMKKMRLSNPSPVPINHENVVTVRILDIPSPSSPVRKQSGGEYDIMKQTLQAPLGCSTTAGSMDENAAVHTNDYIESVDILMKFGVDTPVLDSRWNLFVFPFLTKHTLNRYIVKHV